MSFQAFLVSWIIFGMLGCLLIHSGLSIAHKRMRKKPMEFKSKTAIVLKTTPFGYFAAFVGLCVFVFAIVTTTEDFERSEQAKRAEHLRQLANKILRRKNSLPVDRITVNAALHSLMYENVDPVRAMRIVIAFAHKLRYGFAPDRGRKEDNRENSVITGHTPMHGNITIDHHEKKDDPLHDDHDDDHRARVGQFRVWRCRANLIAFHHFWASDEATRAHNKERARALYIQFNEETLEPECFAGTKEIVWFRLLGHTIYKVFLDALWGKADPSIGKIDIRVR